jgi:hypothetical protein
MQDVVDHALDSAEIAQLIAETAAIIECNKRFHYFGTPEFHKRLCRLEGEGVAKIVPARMARVWLAHRRTYSPNSLSTSHLGR